MDKVFQRFPHRHLIVAAVILLSILGVVWVSGLRAQAESEVNVAGRHIINLHDNGQDIGFMTKKSTLREAIAEAGVRLDPNDRTEPGLDEPLVAASYEVNIYRARPVVIRDGQVETKIISAYRTARQIAAHASVVLQDEDLAQLSPSSDPIADGAAEVLTVTRATPFIFTFYGKTEQDYTQAKTVGDMLKEKKVTMEAADGISVPLDTPITAGMSVKLWRNGKQTFTQEEAVKFDVKKIEDADQPIGYKKVTTAGQNGKRTVTYEINMQNGVEVSRKEINSVTTKQPKQQVEIVGTKISLPAGSHEDWMRKAGIDSSDFGFVNYIFQHESGWNPAAANPVGYYGLGQTSLANISGACPNWQSDPICQTKWFDSYAVSRYGSWKSAYAFKVSRGWW